MIHIIAWDYMNSDSCNAWGNPSLVYEKKKDGNVPFIIDIHVHAFITALPEAVRLRSFRSRLAR